MKNVIFILSIITLNSYGAAINDILELTENQKFRKAQRTLLKNKNELQIEDEFGDKINKSDDLQKTISYVKETISGCDSEIKEAETTPMPEGTDYILDEFQKKCLKNGDLGKYASKINKTYNYKHFLASVISKFQLRYDEVKRRWDLEEEKFQVEQRKKKEYTKTANYSLEETCKAVKMVQHFNKLMSDEERAAKRSGFVNKANMHSWGKSLDYWINVVGKYSKQYKERSGKKFKNSQCK